MHLQNIKGKQAASGEGVTAILFGNTSCEKPIVTN